MLEDGFEEVHTKPIKLIIAVILIAIFIVGLIYLTNEGFWIGEKLTSTAQNTTEKINKMNTLEMKLEKGTILVDRQSIYINKLVIDTTKPVKLKIKLSPACPCIKFVENGRSEIEVTTGLRTEVPIKITSNNCYLKSQIVSVEIYKINEENNTEKLLKKLQFTVLVALSTYLNVFPQNEAHIIGVFDTMKFRSVVEQTALEQLLEKRGAFTAEQTRKGSQIITTVVKRANKSAVVFHSAFDTESFNHRYAVQVLSRQKVVAVFKIDLLFDEHIKKHLVRITAINCAGQRIGAELPVNGRDAVRLANAVASSLRRLLIALYREERVDLNSMFTDVISVLFSPLADVELN